MRLLLYANKFHTYWLVNPIIPIPWLITIFRDIKIMDRVRRQTPEKPLAFDGYIPYIPHIPYIPYIYIYLSHISHIDMGYMGYCSHVGQPRMKGYCFTSSGSNCGGTNGTNPHGPRGFVWKG